MNEAEILEEYKNSGWNAQDLMKRLDEKLKNACVTKSYDDSLAVYEYGELVIMVSSSGVAFFKKDN
jgi:hypothetical protein